MDKIALDSNEYGNSYCIDFERGILEGSADSTYDGYNGTFVLSEDDTKLLYNTMHNYYTNKLGVKP